MSQLKQVWIGIQARSTSARFPRKIFETIGGKSMLGHVVDTCDRATWYLNRQSARYGYQVNYAILCPVQDEVRTSMFSRCMVFEGSEEDVLARYKAFSDSVSADWVIRVTADCPLLPPVVIQNTIKTAIGGDYDYFSNVDPRVRTTIDGVDVEAISKRALNWAHENAALESEREHVTPILRSARTPHVFRKGVALSFLDDSDIKLSVDTPEDLERVRAMYDRRERKRTLAIEAYGRENVRTF